MTEEKGRAKMRRRTFRITETQDIHIGQIAERAGLDKEQVVRMALGVGLPVVDEELQEDVAESIGEILKEGRFERIKKTGVKRRP